MSVCHPWYVKEIWDFVESMHREERGRLGGGGRGNISISARRKTLDSVVNLGLNRKKI
jgi:hypothetical protein